MKQLVLPIILVFLSLSAISGELGDKCFDDLYALPELKPITNKMANSDVTKATFEQLANLEKATDEEKLLIVKLAKGAQTCDEVHMNEQPDLHPIAKKALEDIASSRMASLIDLYNNKISYGEYIKQRQVSISKFKSDMDFVDNDIAEQNAQQEAAERQENANTARAIGESISRSLKPKPSINCNPNGYGGVRCQ